MSRAIRVVEDQPRLFVNPARPAAAVPKQRGRAGKLEKWANKNIKLPDGPHAGKYYRVLREPWREILASFSSDALEQVTLRGPVQSGKTAALIAAALYHFDRNRSVLFYEPNETLKRAVAKRVIAFGRACKTKKVSEAYQPARPPFLRESDKARLEVLSAGEAGAGLSRTARVVIVDELRAFKLDMLQELTERMISFGGRGLLITASSAGYEGECRTSAEYEKSDKRQWFLKCPRCGAESIAAWEAFRLATVRYRMPCCKAELDDSGLALAVNTGRWKATAEAKVPHTRGYHLDVFSGSPFETLATVSRAWRRAREHQKERGTSAEVIAFQTGRLARPFNALENSGVTPEKIMQTCREPYDPTVVPSWASVVIAAVDTQDNRLELELSAWGAVEVEDRDGATELKGWGESSKFKGIAWRGKWYRLRRAALAYHRCYGDPGSPEVWAALEDHVNATWLHASGARLRPCIVGIDAGGHHSADVGEFVRARGAPYQALKGLGQHRYGGLLARKSETLDSIVTYGGNGLLMCCVNSAKSGIFSMLRSAIAGDRPQALQWPQIETHYSIAEFEGICSEALTRVIDKRTGATKTLWVRHRRENEALDLAAYSLCLVNHLGVGFLLAEAESIKRTTEGNANDATT